jgi:hypothetical protein
MVDENKDLFYLEELSDYKVASDYSDVRGWDLIDAGNRTIGKVTNLLVSKKEERVVYLDVEVDRSLIEAGYKDVQAPAVEKVHGYINKDGDDHLLVPVGMVSLDEEHKKVLTDQIDYNTFSRARRFRKGDVIDREYEKNLLRHYFGTDTIGSMDSDDTFYKRKEFHDAVRRKHAKSSS